MSVPVSMKFLQFSSWKKNDMFPLKIFQPKLTIDNFQSGSDQF